ncbi:hypothetical protein Tco_0977127 [Tanacetum coccineum]|uniref:Uncharacterized protein n=1 Tax=Tanacetum coccineum TaxID=301880 RepID=A0ABQ5EJ78_9ASTR
MGDEHLSTFRVEEIVPIPRESEDTFDNNKGCDLNFCDNNMIFSNPLFGSKDNLTSRDDESFLKEDVQEENFQVYSNPLFEIDDNHNSSNINILFNEMLEDVESKDSNTHGGRLLDEIDAFLAIKVSTNNEEGYYDSEGDVFYLESLLSDDTTHNISFESVTLIWEEIDIFPGLDDSIPPGIESDFDSEEEIIFLDNLLNDDISVPEYERFTVDIEPDVPVINNFVELNEDECFDPGGEINVEVDDSFTFFIWTFLPFLILPLRFFFTFSPGVEAHF